VADNISQDKKTSVIYLHNRESIDNIRCAMVLDGMGVKVNMSGKTKKATFNLHPDVLDALDKAMSEGAAPSKNALVERALLKELKEMQRLARQARWEKGAEDPELLKDIGEVENAFKFADAETAGRID
jgi:hypothetical protein